MTAFAESRLIGREAELARVTQFLAGSGARDALVIVGEAGAGKTTLWRAGIALARETGHVVLEARPAEAEIRLDFVALADLLAPVDAETMARLPSPQRRAVEIAIRRAPPHGSPPEGGAIGLGLLATLRFLAERAPVVVAIDDAPKLDPGSLAALTFAARRLDRQPVAFLLARLTDPPSPLERAFDPARAERIALAGLSLGAIRRLLLERLDLTLPRRALRRVFELSRGNPLFSIELGRVLAERGATVDADALAPGDETPLAPAIEDILGSRFEGLPRSLRRLLLAAALSPGLRIDQLLALADSGTIKGGGRPATEALDDALALGVLAVDGDRVRPAHPLVGAVARAHATLTERASLHTRLAAVVDDEELRARHLALATEGHDEALAARVSAAAELAAGRGALEDAIELTRHALRLTAPASPARPRRLMALADHLMVAGEFRQAEALVSPEVDRFTEPAARARAHLLLAESGWSRDLAGSTLHYERAEAEAAGDAGLRATVIARKTRSWVIGLVARIPEAEAMAEQALPAARMAGPETEREILEALAWARRLRGRPLDDLCDRFEAIGGASVSIFRSPARARAELLASRGEVTEARAVLEPLLAEADERGETLSYAFVRLQSCELELRVGEWGAAEARLDEWAESLDRDVIDPEALFRCRAVLEIGRGDAEAAGRWAATAVGDAEAGKHVWSWLEGLRARAGAALLAGRPADAVTDLRTVWLHCLREGVEDPAAFPVAPDLVEALIETAGFDEATQVVKRLDQLAHDQDHPWATATSGRARGLLALGRAKHDEGTEAMRQAAALYGDLGLLFDRARTLLSLGRAQRRDKRWAGARNVLRDAAAAFDEIGSTGWAIVARGELARVAGRKPGAPGDLTPSERRVADLAAEGRSNKEIAQALFVSVDTVETHLSHVYGKLGVESRIQLSRRLAQADSLVAD